MTQDDIVSMAMLARIKVRGHYDESGSTPQELERFANLVAAEEREACAVIAFNAKTYLEAAAAIRARGKYDTR